MQSFLAHRPSGRVARVAVGLLSVVLIAAACSNTPAATTAPSAAASAGASSAPSASAAGGQTIDSIKVAGAGPVLTLDVTKSGDLVSVDTIMLVQGNLFRHNKNGVPQPELAEGVTYSADQLTATLKLKPNLKYSDGSPVTATDVKAAIDRQLAGVEGKPGVNIIFLASVDSVALVDDLTVDIKLKYPDPDLLHGLSARAVTINPADKVAADPDYFTHPISAGPYVVTEYTPNGPLKMKENPNFVNGPMVVKNIEIASVPDQTSKVLQLATGALDFVWDLPIAAKDSFPPEVRQFIIEVGGANTLYLNMDPAGKAGDKFADRRVRQAISIAINRPEIAQKAFLGLVKPLTSFWHECSDICPVGTLPNGGVQDVEKAKALMAEAGVGPDGISAEMLVSSTRGGWKEGATLVAQQLEAIGVHFSVSPVDEATWNGAVANDNFEAVFNGGASSPQITMASWFGTGFSATHSGFVKQEGHDQLPPLITQMAQEVDKAKRKEIYTQIQQIGTDLVPMVSLVNRIALDGIRLPEGVLNVANETPGYMILQTVAEATAGKGAGE
jgi:peptide/nickel transport system substrate-binding protein